MPLPTSRQVAWLVFGPVISKSRGRSGAAKKAGQAGRASQPAASKLRAAAASRNAQLPLRKAVHVRTAQQHPAGADAGQASAAAAACWRGKAVARGCPLAGRAQRPQPPPPRAMVPVAAPPPLVRACRRFTQPFHCSSHRAPYENRHASNAKKSRTFCMCVFAWQGQHW